MTTRRCIAIALVALCGQSVRAQVDQVAWQALRADAVSPRAVDAIIDIRRQVQEVLDAGNFLGASFQYYGDTPSDGYYQFEQPGRIIMMLAAAYPYLSSVQQNAVRTYVTREVGDAAYAPWSTSNFLPTTNIARRSRFVQQTAWNWDRYWGMQGQGWDNLNGVMLYGLWLFAYRSGDWALVNDHWGSITARYGATSAGGNLYGTYGMHIAQARMTQRRNDASARTTAVNALTNRLGEGANFATVDAANSTYFNYFTNARLSWGYHFGGMFLYLPNEIGRWLRGSASTLKDAVVARQNQGKTKFTNWSLYRSPVFCRWSGDEGVGVPSEIVGMMFPVERWVTNPSADSLLAHTIWNAQNSIGDCYVVEATAQTVDACGVERWRDVRNASFVGPGILVLTAGTVIDEQLLIDNPQSQTLSVTYPVRPAFIAGTTAGALSGSAPASGSEDSITAVLSADGTPVDTMRVTVVVVSAGTTAVISQRRRAIPTQGLRVDVLRQGMSIFVSMSGATSAPTQIVVVNSLGRVVLRRVWTNAEGDIGHVPLRDLAEGRYAVQVTQAGRSARCGVLVAR